jgi:L-asparaginase
MSLPHVLVLYTGGTFGMDLQKGRGKKDSPVLAIPRLSPEVLKKRLHDRIPELQHLAHCDFDILLNRDSAHLGPDEWLLFAKKIQDSWKNYDGVVLLHGTDTIAYTASALSFLLRPCLRPVVITGAQRPLSELRTDARNNLISAIEIAAHGPRKTVNQVTVFFGDKLFQGNRVRKKSASDFAAFESPLYPPLAVVGTTIRYSENLPVKIQNLPRLNPSFSRKILVSHVTPAFPATLVTSDWLDRLHALILVIFQSGTGPTHEASFLTLLRTARKKGLPVILVTEGSSQPPNSESFHLNYAAGKELLAEGCFWAGSMTLEAVYVKTALLLAQTKDIKKFSLLWKKDLAGEGAPHS